MPDIQTRQHIETLVSSFYRKVLGDEVIGTFFTEVVQLDFEVHMPTMYDFWESILLGKQVYKGNPMLKHIALNRQKPMQKPHFDRWLGLWRETVEEQFEGPVAEKAIRTAQQIGGLMQVKVKQAG